MIFFAPVAMLLAIFLMWKYFTLGEHRPAFAFLGIVLLAFSLSEFIKYYTG